MIDLFVSFGAFSRIFFRFLSSISFASYSCFLSASTNYLSRSKSRSELRLLAFFFAENFFGLKLLDLVVDFMNYIGLDFKLIISLLDSMF